ncbi:MAG: M48 family metalloprotease [Bacteroidia bacterium]|nr:M48 family metalloprotease [Bacteroidia bacterium]NNC85264.1 M48 family metalloprotease [Bacteroidia bacterium]NNM16663.1 M48 family metalloprotease [Bacteroidia bacterium]
MGKRIKFLIAIGIALFTLFNYYSQSSENPVTGEVQHIGISPDQEIALGLQAAPQMAQQHGGLYPDQNMQNRLKAIGHRIVQNSAARNSPYQFDFHLLRDDKMVNAFALPGGQIFITKALWDRLRTEDQLAGVLGHEIGHVVGRHGAEHMAKAKLTQGLTGAAVIAAYDPNSSSSRNSAAVATMIGNMINMKFGREDELESDRLGIEYMHSTGYNPNEMIEVMKVLEAAGGSGGKSEFFSTHPSPENRIQKIKEVINRL